MRNLFVQKWFSHRIASPCILLTMLACLMVQLGCSSSDSSSAPDLEGVENTGQDPPSGVKRIEVEIDGKPWVTNEPGVLGDPRAVKGGIIRTNILGWPDTLRHVGKSSNWLTNLVYGELCFEPLCELHPQSTEFVPRLASHWHVSKDNRVFRFKLNSNAKWSDGKPVRPEDIIATFKLLQDPTLLAPAQKEITDKFEVPVKIAEDEIEVRCKVIDWRNFISFSTGIFILPAHQIDGLKGSEFLTKFNYANPTGTGPYELKPENVKRDHSVTFTRREDYWDRDSDANRFRYNFDRIRFIVERKQLTAFNSVCKGTLDFYPVYTSKWWVNDITDKKANQRGMLVRQKVYTMAPEGYQGMAFNMRKPPLNDVRVRKSLAHLYNRKVLLKEFAYGELTRLKTYFPNTDGENQDNVMIDFNPKKALDLLNEAGWKTVDSDGYLTKNGKRLSLDLTYRSKFFERYLVRFQQDCKQAGVEIRLRLVDLATHTKQMQDFNFEILGINRGASPFPYPRASWSSEMAEKKNSSNTAGVKSDVIDKLIDEYDAEFDLDRRNELLRQMDAELFQLHPYSLEWYAPCQRLLYWNKFGTPKGVLGKTRDWTDAFYLWWVDPEKEAELKRLKSSGSGTMDVPPYEDKYWLNEPASSPETTEDSTVK